MAKKKVVTMKGNVFGILLIAIGLLLLGQQLNWPYVDSLMTWEAFLILAGVLLITQAFQGKRHTILGGVVLLGLGVHFWADDRVSGWPEDWTAYILIAGIAFLANWLMNKTKSSLFIALLLFAAAALKWTSFDIAPVLRPLTSLVTTYWPTLLIIFGIVILRKK